MARMGKDPCKGRRNKGANEEGGSRVEDGEILIKKIEIGEIWGRTVILSFIHGLSVCFKLFSKKRGFHLLEELIFSRYVLQWRV